MPRLPVMNARRIIPHLIQMSDLAPILPDNFKHLAVRRRVRPIEQALRRFPPRPVPVTANHLKIAGDSPGGNHHALAGRSELPPCAFIDAGASCETPSGPDEIGYAMLKAQREPVATWMTFKVFEKSQ